MKITSFPPISSQKATILILGSMPGETSLHYQQYYAHPRNSFWQMLEPICGTSKSMPYEEKVQCLKEKGIAVWDVLQHCEREGSLDASIKSDTEIPNDFKGFLQSHPNIRYIFFNGQKAEKSFLKLVWSKLPLQLRDRIRLTTLPSTSPANTRLSREMKQAEWQSQIIAACKSTRLS